MDVIDSIRWLFDDLMQRFFPLRLTRQDAELIANEMEELYQKKRPEYIEIPRTNMAWKWLETKFKKKLNHL